MLIRDIEFTLHDGRKAVLRSPNLGDAEECLQLLRTAAKETPFVGRSPQDCEECDLTWQTDYIRKMNMGSHTYMVVCEVEGTIVATGKLWFEKRERERHRGSLTICVLSDYWRQGIGKQMMLTMKAIAKNRDGITQLELYTASTNYRAQELYHSVGFRTVAVLPNSHKLAKGEMLDRYFMVCEI